MKKQMITVTSIETDLGTMVAGATDKGICMFEFADSKYLASEVRQLTSAAGAPLAEGDNPHFDTLRRQVGEYFAGRRRAFDIPLDPVGTPFQKQVWNSLRQIPYGNTVTYGEQAAAIGKPSAARAVAGANGKNKISIILPCHRVIGADGSLTGYGGGIARKKRLLELERATSQTPAV